MPSESAAHCLCALIPPTVQHYLPSTESLEATLSMVTVAPRHHNGHHNGNQAQHTNANGAAPRTPTKAKSPSPRRESGDLPRMGSGGGSGAQSDLDLGHGPGCGRGVGLENEGASGHGHGHRSMGNLREVEPASAAEVATLVELSFAENVLWALCETDSLKGCIDEIDLGLQYHHEFLTEIIIHDEATTLRPAEDRDVDGLIYVYARAGQNSRVRRRNGPEEDGLEEEGGAEEGGLDTTRDSSTGSGKVYRVPAVVTFPRLRELTLVDAAPEFLRLEDAVGVSLTPVERDSRRRRRTMRPNQHVRKQNDTRILLPHGSNSTRNVVYIEIVK
ncbi:uncharacterized protein BXZ73DRAFT_109270 [Epithele typhae]|uniref:uncharacterized protein n=1 Tax=Epithele typhae TaxID=378194 RepID=UPI002007863B|nr:uncharacterized protein BXZ73DRAFT_109270 [Epithele typhae]KAH9910262.1 hypothetical protein BXZ73DRAFT_109270 [Epithele typhae]